MSDIINKPYWDDTSFDASPPKAFYLPDKTETVIIGAGIHGLLMGLWLAMQGHKSYIFDGTSPGMRSSLRGDGIIGMGPCCLPSKLLNNVNGSDILKLIALSIDNHQIIREIIRACGPEEWCEYENFGGIHIGANDDEKYIESSLALYNQLDMRASLLSDTFYSKIVDINYGKKAIFIPQIATLNPKLLINGLIQANEIMGNKVFIGMFLGNIYGMNGSNIVSDDIGNAIVAKNVIICLNGMINGAKLNNIEKYISVYRAQYLTTKEIEKPKITQYPININNKFILRGHKKHILIGTNTKEFSSSFIDKISTADAKVDVSTMVLGYSFLKKIIDIKDENEISYIWSRNITKTKDNLPLIGKVQGYNNVYISSGYDIINNLSYTGTACKIIGEHILKGKTSVYGAELLSPERFDVKKELLSNDI